ncbi:parallel beta-helix repeat protein [Kribbella voronezhensis]|uniref:Parallel beta-helix repeat protein n=1 Tax=Kribbella voronezhensis TaxID=2512212 RepID=A0A4R7SYZ3_9ACTN|nr:right-handed parallel beta-helix repeat-containing protein [Kribbella voronezhensis]TDU83946.1 parallel beta-helix repeat protein [Kribbella voronezhensis]
MRPTRILGLCATALVPAVLLALPTQARATTTTLYVDRTVACSDSGPGTTTTPYCTIGKGVSNLAAGRILYIGNGSYAETIKPAVSGTASAPITITRWAGRTPTVTGSTYYGANLTGRSYVTVSGLTFTGTVADGIYVSNGDHLTVTGNTVTGAGRQAQGRTAPGISVRGATSSVVSGNYVHHNNGSGILLTAGATGITVSGNTASFNAEGYQRNANGINVVSPGNAVLRNLTHDNEDSGMQFYPGGNNNLAALNVTYNNGDHGIDNLNVTGGRIISNTVYRNCTTGINVEGTSGSYHVVNNIAVDNAVYPAYRGISCARRAGNIGIWDSAPASTIVDHNLVWLTTAGKLYAFSTTYTSLAAMQAATHQEAHGVQADPRFLSTATWDLRLRAGSAAIDRGDSGVSGAQASDFTGAARYDDLATANTFAEGLRRYDDLGAFEFRP